MIQLCTKRCVSASTMIWRTARHHLSRSIVCCCSDTKQRLPIAQRPRVEVLGPLQCKKRANIAKAAYKLVAACHKDVEASAAHGTGESMNTMKLVLVVAVALIDKQHRVLLAQRPTGKPMAGLWEFPGGKVDEGETPEDALVRELHEELNIQVEAEDLLPLTFASHTYDSFHLLMPLYVCRQWQGEVRGVEGQQLSWVSQQHIHDYAMPAADLPLVPTVLQAMNASQL